MARTPGGFTGTKEEQRIAQILREAEVAKLEKIKDRFNLRPVAKGFVRGMVINIQQHEEPCEYGTLQVIQFELSDTPKGPGIPVRMAGTYFNHRLMPATLLDVPDPTPDIRPITPNVAYHSRSDGGDEFRAFYPGRGEMPRRVNLVLAVVGVAAPVAAIVGAIWALYHFHIV